MTECFKGNRRWSTIKSGTYDHTVDSQYEVEWCRECGAVVVCEYVDGRIARTIKEIQEPIITTKTRTVENGGGVTK